MTPDQQKLIDAAAKVYYERVNTFNEEHGLPYTKWDDLSQEYKEDLLYPVVIGPVTVALRAAVEELKGWRDIYGDNAAAAMSSQHRRRRMKPDEIAKCIPDEVVEAALRSGGFSIHADGIMRLALAAGLAA